MNNNKKESDVPKRLRIKELLENKKLVEDNSKAKELAIRNDEEIVYEISNPLELKDDRAVYSICKNGEVGDQVSILVNFYEKDKVTPGEFRLRIYNDESLEDIETFLENAKDIFRLQKLDLRLIN